MKMRTDKTKTNICCLVVSHQLPACFFQKFEMFSLFLLHMLRSGCHVLTNPRRMCSEGYGSHPVCICMRVSVGLSVSTVVAV